MTYQLSYKNVIKALVAFILAYTVVTVLSYKSTQVVNYRLYNTVASPYDTIVAPDKPPVH
jgi:hypothetical protein